jgi:hypothetical protein
MSDVYPETLVFQFLIGKIKTPKILINQHFSKQVKSSIIYFENSVNRTDCCWL